MLKIKQYFLCIVSENSYVTLSVCQTCSPVIYMAQDLIGFEIDSHATAFQAWLPLKFVYGFYRPFLFLAKT